VDILVPTERPRAQGATVTFKYIPALDGMRAVAVLFVVFFHAVLIVPGLQPYTNGGFLGVDIFFVLSGFLITSILLQEFDRTGSMNFKNFYTRRFLRLMPAYWLQLAGLFVFATWLFPQDICEKLYANNNFLYAFLYLSNWQRALNGSEVMSLLNHTWSLAIEEQFYLFWAGFLFLMLRRLSRERIVSVTAGMIVFTAFFRAFRWQGRGSVDFLYNAFDSRMDALLVGCLVSQLISWGKLPQAFLSSRALDLLGLISLWVAVLIIFGLSDSYYSPFLYQGGFTLFALAIGMIVIWLVAHSNDRVSSVLSTGPLTWIGKTSYGLYLWHSISISFFFYFQMPPWLMLISAVLSAFSLTALSYYLVELPFLRLKQRFS